MQCLTHRKSTLKLQPNTKSVCINGYHYHLEEATLVAIMRNQVGWKDDVLFTGIAAVLEGGDTPGAILHTLRNTCEGFM